MTSTRNGSSFDHFGVFSHETVWEAGLGRGLAFDLSSIRTVP